MYLRKTFSPLQATLVLILKLDCRNSMMVQRDMDPLASRSSQGA